MGVDSYVVVGCSVVMGEDGDRESQGRHGNVRELLQVEGEEVRVEKRRMEK